MEKKHLLRIFIILFVWTIGVFIYWDNIFMLRIIMFVLLIFVIICGVDCCSKKKCS